MVAATTKDEKFVSAPARAGGLAAALVLSFVLHMLLLLMLGWQAGGGAPRRAPLQLTLREALSLKDTPASTPEATFTPQETVVPPVQDVKSVPRRTVVKGGGKTKTTLPETVPAPPLPHVAPTSPVKDETPSQSAGLSGDTTLLTLPGASSIVRQAEITFGIFTGPERRPGGQAQHHFIADRQGGYYGVKVAQLAEDGNTPDWSLEVSGTIREQGLSPKRFSMTGEMPRRLMALQETVGAADRVLDWKMPDGLLDRQSLIYQFMARPPARFGGSLWLSDGERHLKYVYRPVGFDALPPGIPGLGQALKLEIRAAEDAGEELVELWLLPDRHYLPVRVRYTDSLGEVTEMVATSFDFKE